MTNILKKKIYLQNISIVTVAQSDIYPQIIPNETSPRTKYFTS